MVEGSCSAHRRSRSSARSAVLRLAARERVVLEIEGVADVVDALQHRPEGAPVGDHAADRDAAEADAVIGALAPDQPVALALAARPMIGDRDFERGVNGFRSGVGEEHAVEVARHLVRDPRGQLEHLVVAELEGRREIERRDALLHRLDHLGMAVAEIGAPQARRAVQDVAAVVRAVMHALGADHKARVRLELAVRGERLPERLQIVRRPAGASSRSSSSSIAPSLIPRARLDDCRRRYAAWRPSARVNALQP